MTQDQLNHIATLHARLSAYRRMQRVASDPLHTSLLIPDLNLLRDDLAAFISFKIKALSAEVEDISVS